MYNDAFTSSDYYLYKFKDVQVNKGTIYWYLNCDKRKPIKRADKKCILDKDSEFIMNSRNKK